jgi:hypothetical protein
MKIRRASLQQQSAVPTSRVRTSDTDRSSRIGGSWYWCVLSSAITFVRLLIISDLITGFQQHRENKSETKVQCVPKNLWGCFDWTYQILPANITGLPSHRLTLQRCNCCLFLCGGGVGGRCKPIEMHSKLWEIWYFGGNMAEEASFVGCEALWLDSSKQSDFSWIQLTLEYEDTSVLQNLGNHSTDDTVWNRIRLEPVEQFNQRHSLKPHKTLNL